MKSDCRIVYVSQSIQLPSCTLAISGVCWVDMHKLAERVQLEELVKFGLVQGDVDAMMKVCSFIHQSTYISIYL